MFYLRCVQYATSCEQPREGPVNRLGVEGDALADGEGVVNTRRGAEVAAYPIAGGVAQRQRETRMAEALGVGGCKAEEAGDEGRQTRVDMDWVFDCRRV